ncbi:Serine/threonine-protein kinase PK-1 [Massilia sp. Bi118]|uniref:serine/threonine protein kinase n=1 Tax=Massilia sp. Bi118 TaxID=2822346 RepID=UPI001D9E4F0D|nr:serine/threonine protein kinase [Massilia sp. Bi118]CAH0224130.1 Serine/threonine-protein kinase PK-1 [Massilia sp. Bi118]
MDSLADTLRLFQSGSLGQAEMFARLDRLLADTHESVSSLLKTLNEAHRRSPLPAEVYGEVERRIARAIEVRQRSGRRIGQRVGDEETFVQTKPLQPTQPGAYAGANANDAPVERMKGVGDTLNGRFVLEECIGFGGMGTVYKALDLRKLEASDRHPYIAIKVLNVQFQGHPKSLIALQREARKAQTLAHANIVQVYDFDRDGSMVYVTMEYLAGKSLGQLLRAPDFRALPFEEAMKIVRGMGKALSYAHERGFVHCDFKPANVVLLDAGGVKVIDFGIARVFQKAEEAPDVTVFDPGSLGALTPAYASPEMLENREPDPRDDIYALGCITYELLTGKHPFNRLSATQARDAGLRPQRPPRLGHRQWRALRCALSFQREQRTPSVNQFLQEIGAQDVWQKPSFLVGVGLSAVAALVVFVALRLFLWNGAEKAAPPAGAADTASGSPQGTPQARAPQQAQAPPQAAPPAQSVQPAPKPSASAPSLPAVSAALADLPCSALAPTIKGRTVRVQGYIGRSSGKAHLKNTLMALPGVSGVDLAVQEVDENKCALLGVLGRYWVAHRMAPGAAADTSAIKVNRESGRGTDLKAGATLLFDVTSPAYQSYLAVDYFTLDGKVVHMLPTLLERETFAPPNYTATIGSLNNWGVGAPFGTEMVVLMATPEPLFGGVRANPESGADYLRALDEQLARVAKSHGAAAVTVEFLQITTHPKR